MVSGLTNENFWQGTTIGLTVSALNHVAHRMVERKNIISILRNKNLDPTAAASMDLETVNQIKDGSDVLFDGKQVHYQNAEFEIVPVISHDSDALGYTSANFSFKDGKLVQLNSMNKIQLSWKAFRTNYRLAQTVVHELFHYIDLKLNSMYFFNTYGENSFHGIMEFRAYNFTL